MYPQEDDIQIGDFGDTFAGMMAGALGASAAVGAGAGALIDSKNRGRGALIGAIATPGVILLALRMSNNDASN